MNNNIYKSATNSEEANTEEKQNIYGLYRQINSLMILNSFTFKRNQTRIKTRTRNQIRIMVAGEC